MVNRYTMFLSKVDAAGFDPRGCWTWCGAGKGNGYGNVTVNRRQLGAHRHSYELFCGPVPDGMDVCHSCDNRWCVNPDHLFLGDRKTNMADCVSKGRATGGNRKHLKEAAIQEIRRRLRLGLSASRIANDLDVNYATVNSINRGDSYVGIGE